MKLLAPFLLLAAGLLIAAGLGGKPSGADLVLVHPADVFTLDPQRQSYLRDFRLGLSLYEGLLRREDDEIVPAAAAAMPEISDGGRVYTFTLRDDARWSNGHAVTAHDFVYSWMRLLLPDTAADYSHMLFCIEGAEAFWRWRSAELQPILPLPRVGGEGRGEGAGVVKTESTADSLRSLAVAPPDAAEASWRAAEERFKTTVGVRALDDLTLQVTLQRPVAYFLDLLCFAVCCPVYRPCVEGWPAPAGDDAERLMQQRGWTALAPPPLRDCRWLAVDPASGRMEQAHQWARPGVLVGNGPYVLAAWRYKRDLRLEANPFYHSPQIVRSRSILIETIEDANTRVLAFESGRIDWLTDVSAEYQADMLAQRAQGARSDIHALAVFGTDFYSFNCRPRLADGSPNPFHDPRVRRAFARSVDRAAIVAHVTRLEEPVIATLIPPGCLGGYSSPKGLEHDPDGARAELAAAGWEDRDGDGLIENAVGSLFPVVDLLYTTTTPRYRWVSLEVKGQWERALGVRVSLRGTDTKFYKEDLRRGKFMVARGRWYGDYGDPMTFLEICRSGDGNNDRGYESPEYDRMLTQADLESDPARRLAALSECERFLMEVDAPLVSICQLVDLTMYDPQRLSGVSHHPRAVQHLFKLEARR